MAMNNSLAEVRPELVPEWSEKNLPLKPDEITFGSNKKVWWSPLLQSPDEGRTDTALGGSGTESQQDGGNNPEPDGTERGSDRTDESRGYDEMGLSDELPSQLGTGNRESGSDIRLEYYDRTHEDKSLPFFGRDEAINEILRTTPHLSASLEEIKDYYERNPDNKDRTEYIKSIFNND